MVWSTSGNESIKANPKFYIVYTFSFVFLLEIENSMNLRIFFMRFAWNRLNKNINILENGNFHISISILALFSIQKRKTLLFKIFLAVIFLLKIPPHVFRLVWHYAVSRCLIWHFLAEVNLCGPLFIKIQWTSFSIGIFSTVINLDHVALDFVLLRIYDWLHAYQSFFVVYWLWYGKAGTNWLN